MDEKVEFENSTKLLFLQEMSLKLNIYNYVWLFICNECSVTDEREVTWLLRWPVEACEQEKTCFIQTINDLSLPVISNCIMCLLFFVLKIQK